MGLGPAELFFDRHGRLQELAGQRIGLEQAGIAAFIDDLAALGAGVRAEVHDVIGQLDDIGVMLNHQHRVAFIAQL